MSCGVDHRCSLDLVLLWLWCRPAATAPIRPLAWEPPYAMGAALKRQKDQKEKKINSMENLQMRAVKKCLFYNTLFEVKQEDNGGKRKRLSLFSLSIYPIIQQILLILIPKYLSSPFSLYLHGQHFHSSYAYLPK